MKKLKFLLFLALVVVIALVTCSCMDTNSVNSILSNFGLSLPHTCVDADGNTMCDICNAYVAPMPCTEHVDNNADGVCDRTGCGANVLMEMTTVVFSNLTKVYDGAPKTIEVKQAPKGAKIKYNKENTQTDVGVYKITATITAEGYQDCELTATLKINPKPIDVAWGNVSEVFPANGKAPTIEYTLDGVIEGDEVNVTLDFGGHDFTQEGEATVTAKIDNPNYKLNSKTSSATVIFGPNVRTVTFETGVPGRDYGPEVVLDGAPVDEPRALVRNGYNFLGWYKGEVKWNFTNAVTQDITLTAKWEVIEYTITYSLNGGVNNSANPDKYTVEDGIKLFVPEREGKVFVGWYEDSTYATPLSKTAPGERANNLNLYAKWANADYSEIISGDSVDASFVLDNYLAAGTARYTFSANIASLLDDGAIYIGRGKNTPDGSYFKITSKNITLYTNGDSLESETRSHIRSLSSFVVIDIEARTNGANITVRTGSGQVSAFFSDFVGKNGEIFVSAENIELTKANFAWNCKAYEEPVWILADSTVSFTESTSWARYIANSGYLDVLLMSARDVDSTEVLEAFEYALSVATPKYAIWSFDKESGASYDANLESFIAKCKQKGITPILTTQFEASSAANKAKNEAVVASGERYIDFASIEKYSGLYSSGYTEFGAESLYAKVLADFPEILTPTTPLKSGSAAVLNAESDTILLDEQNSVKDGKFWIFTAKIDGTLGEDQKIIITQGYKEAYGAWVEVNGAKIVSYIQGTSGANTPKEYKESHKLTILNYITVIMTSDRDGIGNKITVITDGGSYTTEWSGDPCRGKIMAKAEGVVLTDAKMHWACQDYAAPIWLFGASYFSLGDSARWPHYLYKDGFTDDVLMVGRGGMNSTQGLEELKDALQYATPKYIAWGYGMNDGKDTTTIHETAYKNFIEFLDICEEYDIEPIFFSVVNATSNLVHTHKIDYIKNRLGDFAKYDYRVIDVPHAVDGYEPGTTWYEGMLYEDGTHPTQLGARNIYLQALVDFPELMIGADANVKSASSATLSKGQTLKVEGTPEFIDGDMAISMKADFESSLTGAIEIGNGKGVEAGTWVKITEGKVQVYRTVNGADVLVKEIDNEITMKELVMIRIVVTDNKANIAFVSSGEDNYDPKKDRKALFSVEVDWSYAGDVFVSADSADLTDVLLNFVTE